MESLAQILAGEPSIGAVLSCCELPSAFLSPDSNLTASLLAPGNPAALITALHDNTRPKRQRLVTDLFSHRFNRCLADLITSDLEIIEQLVSIIDARPGDTCTIGPVTSVIRAALTQAPRTRSSLFGESTMFHRALLQHADHMSIQFLLKSMIDGHADMLPITWLAFRSLVGSTEEVPNAETNLEPPVCDETLRPAFLALVTAKMSRENKTKTQGCRFRGHCRNISKPMNLAVSVDRAIRSSVEMSQPFECG
jgi:hypothetical protein